MKGAPRYWILLLALAFVQAAGVAPAAGQGAPGASSARGPAAGRTIGIKLLDAPESRRADPRAHAYIVDHVAPGATIERRVEVTNESSGPMHVDVYAAAATIAKGRFTFAPERTPDELTGWTSLDTTGLELAASETARVRTTVRVPRDAAAGERYGVIWAQTGTSTDRSHTMTMLGRVGVRMYIDVGPGGEPPSDFKIERLYPTRARDGRAEVRARIHNTGGRALDISGALSLFGGPGGLRAGPFSARTGTTLAPGDLAETVVPLDARLPDGPWTAAFTLKSGLVAHTTRATLTFPATPGSTGAVAASAARQGRFPTPVAAGLSALVLAALCLLPSRFLRRRR
ncbi:peptidase [Streptomyces tropicalis]|uniref:Peptidase n=1 Tax=Streptomyces tropicalis TaxID=3034234 RepID=A0ABT5ZZ82_9ACTN|nr:peptidase [Streptomyces tropicalis]MDF3297517.1 peptidase [Streptomyces tropicalis]